MKALLLAALFFFLLIPATAKADMWVGASAYLLPILPAIIAVEILVFVLLDRKYLKLQVTVPKAIAAVISANLVTTFIGFFFPISGTLQPSGLFTYFILMTIAYIGTSLFEAAIYLFFIKGSGKEKRVFEASFIVNLVSYILIALFIFSMLPEYDHFDTPDVGTFATDSRRALMMNEFGKGGQILLATLPASYNYTKSPGLSVRFLIGVKRNSSILNKEYFALCMTSYGANGGCTPINPALTKIEGDTSGVMFRMSKNVIMLENRGEVKVTEATMLIPPSAEGTNKYTIYACPVDSPTGRCEGPDESYGKYEVIVDIR
jgi:hypothetical protein